MITLNSGFLEMVLHGDCILADCGFLIEEELATHGAVLRIPALTQGKNSWQLEIIIYLNKFLTFRYIHVEHVIGQLKKFKILGSVIPICIVDLLDEIMISVCGLINLNPSVICK